MLQELKVYGLFLGLFVVMGIAYTGFEEESVPSKPTRTVEAQEITTSEYPAPAETEVEVEPHEVDLLTYSFVEKSEPELVSMGTFKVTAYCSCRECCGKWADYREDGVVRGASGQELIPGYSVAVDTNVIPYGNAVYLNGQKYVAHDCGGSVKGNCIDLYMDSHEKAQEWGVQYIEVFKEVEK